MNYYEYLCIKPFPENRYMIYTALFIGIAYGYISVKGQFCMNSGFSNVARTGDTTKLKSFVTAILLQAAILPLTITVLQYFNGEIASQVQMPPLHITGTVVGGFLFGVGMHFSGGCGAGIFFKIGEKSTGALIAAIGFIGGVVLMEKGFLYDYARLARGSILFQQPSLWNTENSYTIQMSLVLIITAIASLALLFLLKERDKKPGNTDWGWKKTGLSIGLTGIVGWLSALGAGMPFGMSVIPGALDITTPVLSWASLFIVGIPMGAWWSARGKGKKFTLPTYSIALRRLSGGLILGLTASFAVGCTMGHGLTFVPLMGVGSMVGIASIFMGSFTVGYLTRK